MSKTDVADDAANTAAPPARERTGVQSLERAFALLEAVAGHADGVTLSDLAREVGLHTSTAFHLARTLVNLGYARQDAGTKRYHLGRMAFALASASRDEIELVSIATPVLERMARETGESSHLALYAGNEVAIVARTSGAGAFQLQPRHGTLRPGHATAVGKVLLAALDAGTLDAYLARHGQPALTDRTITDRARLDEELAGIRSAGIAYDDGEYDPEVRCLAMPVRDFSGRVVAAIGMSGPVWRVTLQTLTDLGTVLEREAARLSRELGARPADLRSAG